MDDVCRHPTVEIARDLMELHGLTSEYLTGVGVRPLNHVEDERCLRRI